LILDMELVLAQLMVVLLPSVVVVVINEVFRECPKRLKMNARPSEFESTRTLAVTSATPGRPLNGARLHRKIELTLRTCL
jgi:hypothetical protein